MPRIKNFRKTTTNTNRVKRGILSSQPLPLNLSAYRYCHPPNNTEVLSSHPSTTLTFLPWWFVISKTMPGVLRLIQIESQFSYDLLLWYLLRLNLVKSRTNTPCVLHVETTWKCSFPRRFNVEYMWNVCRVTIVTKNSILDAGRTTASFTIFLKRGWFSFTT